VRIFKNESFERFALKNDIDNNMLCKAVYDADKGLVEADLGGGVIKQRIARKNEGKSGGYRSIICYRKGDKAFFIHGYAKKDKANITADDKKMLKDAAKILLKLSDHALKEQVKYKKLIEVRL
jgi:hypothetical protein